MFFYIVGPSGCGKTTVCDCLSKKYSDFAHYNLDSIVSSICGKCGILGSWNEFGFLSIELSMLIEKFTITYDNKKIALIDVGAGSLQSEDFRNFIQERKCNLIFLGPWENDEPYFEECYNRVKTKQPDRTKENYRKLEFKQEIIDIYKISNVINTKGENIISSVKKLYEEVQKNKKNI